MNILVKMFYGSHLYGLNTPSSDVDFKGIYLPTYKQILTCNIPKTITNNTKNSDTVKNTAEDVDEEFYSLHYFFKLAKEGETVALDMLHAPSWAVLKNSETWEMIQRKRNLFYTKKLKSYLGYARNQVAKYSIKGDRLGAATKVLDYLNDCKKYEGIYGEGYKIKNIWENLPITEFTYFETHENLGVKQKFYVICARKIADSISIDTAISYVEKIINSYGKRAQLAMDNSSIDWKAVTHALRACDQLEELYKCGTITFPLKTADFLKKVKSGFVDFATVVSPMLDEKINLVEQLAERSGFPDKVNNEEIDNLLYTIVDDETEKYK